jgi:hypothetical protein
MMNTFIEKVFGFKYISSDDFVSMSLHVVEIERQLHNCRDECNQLNEDIEFFKRMSK